MRGRSVSELLERHILKCTLRKTHLVINLFQVQALIQYLQKSEMKQENTHLKAEIPIIVSYSPLDVINSY